MSFLPFKLSPFLQDIVATVITSVLTIVCLVVATSALAHGLGPEQFGAYSIIKRLLNNLEPWVTLSTGISVARYVAIKTDPKERLTYLRAGACLIFFALVPTLLLGILFPSLSIRVLFGGGESYFPLLVATLVLIASYCFYILLYAYYRGIRKMGAANIWQTVVIAAGPMIIALALSSPDRLVLILYLNSALLAASIFPLMKHLEIFSSFRQDVGEWKRATRELAQYGIPRVPGGLIYGGLLSFGPMGASYLGSLKEAGFLVIGQSILKIYEGGIEGFGRAAMPAISSRVSQSGKAAIRDRISDLLGLIFDMGLFLTIHSIVWMGPVLILWLGVPYEGAILPVKILTISLVPYLAFVTLRSVLDAVEERALTTGYLTAAISLTAISSFILIKLQLGALGFAIGTAMGITLLGFLCAARVCKDFELNFASFVSSRIVVLNVLLGVVSLGLKEYVFDDIYNHFFRIAALVIIATLGSGLYLLCLSRLRPGWYKMLRARVSRA